MDEQKSSFKLKPEQAMMISELNGVLETAHDVHEESKVRLFKANRALDRFISVCKKTLGVPDNYVLTNLGEGFEPPPIGTHNLESLLSKGEKSK